MLTRREFATLRAALLFWREEMHETALMAPYFDAPAPDPLSPEEVDDLRALLQPEAIRYGHFDSATQQLASRVLYLSAEEAQEKFGPSAALAAILLPTT